MKAIALIALLTLASACSVVPEQARPDYWMFSWLMRNGTYRFMVVRESERYAFLNGFRPSFPGHGSMAQAQAQLQTLPRGVLVGWGDATCSGLTYPPKDIMRPIEFFAAAHKINLVILPGRCDER